MILLICPPISIWQTLSDFMRRNEYVHYEELEPKAGCRRFRCKLSYEGPFVKSTKGDTTMVCRCSTTTLPTYDRRDDLGIVLSALRYLEESTGEKFDDEDGIIKQIEHDHDLSIAAGPPKK